MRVYEFIAFGGQSGKAQDIWILHSFLVHAMAYLRSLRSTLLTETITQDSE